MHSTSAVNNITTLSPQVISHEQQFSTQALMFDDHLYNRVMALAHLMSQSKVAVPHHLRGNPSDCAAIILQALRWGIDPFTVAQKTHSINGTLGYEAQLVITLINSQAPIQGRLQYEHIGPWDELMSYIKQHDISKLYTKKNETYQYPWPQELESSVGVRVRACLTGEDIPREHIMYLNEVFVRTSSLWKTSPKQQLSYLAAKFWARLYCPDIILGIYSSDELLPAAGLQTNPASPAYPPVVIDAQTYNQEPRVSILSNTPDGMTNAQFDISAYLKQIQTANNMEELNIVASEIKKLNLATDNKNRLIMLQYYESRKRSLTLCGMLSTLEIHDIDNVLTTAHQALSDGALMIHDYDYFVEKVEEWRHQFQ